MIDNGIHMIVNDVLETPKGMECAKLLYKEAFPDPGWNIEVCNASDLKDVMAKKLKSYTDVNGKFDLTLCLTTGGARFFYAHPMEEYSKRMAVLPCSTTHGCKLKTTAKALCKELERVGSEKPKILVLDGEVSIFGYTEKKMDNVRKAIGIWSGNKADTKLGVGVLSRGYYDYNTGHVVRLKEESDLRKSIDFCSIKGVDCVTRLSEDMEIMRDRKMGSGCEYFHELSRAIQKRNESTGNLPL
jgi:hypothetical protein